MRKKKNKQDEQIEKKREEERRKEKKRGEKRREEKRERDDVMQCYCRFLEKFLMIITQLLLFNITYLIFLIKSFSTDLILVILMYM